MVDPQGFFEYVEGPANDRMPYSDEPEDEPLPDPVVVDDQDAGSSFGPIDPRPVDITNGFGHSGNAGLHTK